MDGRMDRPYFIGPLWLRPEVQRDLEYHLACELNTVTADASEKVELKDAFYLHFFAASDLSHQEVIL